MIDAVLMDWEGILVETADARRDALRLALRDEGVEEGTARDDPTLVELLALRARRNFAERIGKGFTLVEGGREFIESAHGRSRLAIVTGATRAESEFVLRLAGIEGAIATLVSGDDLPLSSRADLYLAAIAQLGRIKPIRREQVLVLASTAVEIAAAHSLGVQTVAIHAPAHVAMEADAAVESLRCLTIDDLARLAERTEQRT